MRRGDEILAAAGIQMRRCKVFRVHRTNMFPHGDRRMKQFNRKPMFLALALAFAAPLAFAQSTTPQSTTPQSTTPQSTTDTAQQPTQDATTQAQDAATQAQGSTTPTYPQSKTDMSGTTAATPAPTSSSPQKKNWSDLDVDKNGTLSATEAAPVNSLSKVFTAADVNSDGELSQDEYKAYLASNGKGKAPGSGN